MFICIFGSGTGFSETAKADTEWTVSCTRWPVSRVQLENAAGMIKDSKCTWLHCVLDMPCGKEVLQRPSSWQGYSDGLADTS